MEAYEYFTPEGTGTYGTSTNKISLGRGASDAEKKLFTDLKDRVAVISIANPSSLIGSMNVKFPRLEVSKIEWLSRVEVMISEAAFIIFVW